MKFSNRNENFWFAARHHGDHIRDLYFICTFETLIIPCLKVCLGFIVADHFRAHHGPKCQSEGLGHCAFQIALAMTCHGSLLYWNRLLAFSSKVEHYEA